VAGVVGPVIVDGAVQQDVEASYGEQVRSLLSGGVDLILIETAVSMDQVRNALSALRSLPDGKGVPAWVSISAGMASLAFDQVVEVCRTYQVSLLGVNCGSGPESFGSDLASLTQYYDGPLYCSPSAGIPDSTGAAARYPINAGKFVTEFAALLQSYRILVAGGCCGTTPEYIAEMQTLQSGAIGKLRP
jgi:5-methyltetrahydrofolate--homocysteine methyltransferase